MALQTLDLDPLYLTYRPEQLQLSVKSRAEFKFPSGVALHRIDLARAIASGSIWVRNARVCRIDIRISIDDRPLDGENRARILESLERHILNANLWPQLPLSVSLEISQLDQPRKAQFDLSILLSESSSNSTAHPRGWILDDVEVRVPQSVLSVRFDKLQVWLDFHTLQEILSPVSKVLKTHHDELDSMLLDEFTDLDKSHFKVFEETVDRLTHSLPSLMASCLGQLDIPLPEHGTTLLNSIAIPPSLPLQQGPRSAASPRSVTQSTHKTNKLNSKHLLPKEAKDKLQAWLDRNADHPYPSSEEKLRLMEETGLQRSQLKKWFYNARRRLAHAVKDERSKKSVIFHIDGKNPLSKPISFREDKIFSNPDQSAISTNQLELGDHDDTPSLLDDAVPSLESQPSTQSSTRSAIPLTPYKRSLPSQSLPSPAEFSLSCCHVLTSAALNVLVGGSACRRSLQNIAVESAYPKTPLSSLAPTLFSPGFKQLMAHNSRFLPTISRAMSSSWMRNCQGPGLRAKLLELATLTLPGSDRGLVAQSGGPSSVEKLSAVVQGRVWSMMQRKLSDPAVGKLKWETLDPSRIAEREDPDVDEDLLRSVDGDGRIDMDPIARANLKQFIEGEYMDDDEELLLFDPMSDGEGLLSYFDEMEELELQKQTDEMLFGSGEYEGEDDSEIMLLPDEDNEESMLL